MHVVAGPGPLSVDYCVSAPVSVVALVVVSARRVTVIQTELGFHALRCPRG
jgi:hypothetical protein